MAELTNQFCESTGSAEITLSQYGRYLGDAEKPPLPFLNERTVVSYFTGEPGTLKLGNTIYSIEPGMVIVLFPGVCINATAMAGAKIDAMWMELDGEALPTVLMRAGLTPQKPLLFPAVPEGESEMVAAFAKLTDPEAQYGPLRATGLAMEVLDCLLRETPRPCQPKIANLQRYYVDKSIRFIKTKYPQDISVEDVAEYCGLNRSYLGKLFRDATGMTTQEYLIRHRMSVACSYLERAAAPIATIARSVGYPNQLHFSRAFHKVFGIPPREWQKRNRRV
ncbi:MAG TPA: AraC family transcriptional regulator [Candidatus Butyricicoccus stercorigallinarum]|nr:AraC family transcriptional regulator [Candidatus Butyricicoccus stercorigallinarum]